MVGSLEHNTDTPCHRMFQPVRITGRHSDRYFIGSADSVITVRFALGGPGRAPLLAMIRSPIDQY
jgi:hypothetical protein